MALQLSLNVAGLQDAQVGPDVQKIGVSFRSFPPEPVVINSVMPETWGQGRFQGGEEVVAVNGIDVATMDRDAFREALQVRPLTIRFRVPAQDQLDSVVAEKGVEKIGLVFQQLPPAPVIVSKVQEGSWAAQQGFEGGEEIVMVNGKELSQMSADDFKKALKEERPLALRFRPRELPDGVEELVAEKEVGKIGLSFLKMPPEPVIVNKVIPGCWAEEVGFQGGEEIVALDGAPVASMTPETFKAALQQRPLRLRFRPAGHKEQEEQEEEEEDDEEPVEVTADAKVKKIGLSFRELPPQPVVVSKVVPETWASQMGFRGGEEIVALNGQPCEAMNSATFKELLGIRPLTLRYFPPLEAEPAEPEEPAELHEREAAATKIQALHRGKTARAAVAAQKEERINAATKIQAVQRGNRERKAVAEDKSRRAASIAPESPATPQTPATAARPRPPAAPPAIPRPPATPSPKKKKRQDPVRPNVPDLDVQKREEAAKRIQAVQRGKAARTATAVERQQREDAATKIQAVQRGKAARRATADEKQHREEAAKKIQAVQRGKAARAATADEKQQREDAATKIQAVQRGKAARRATADEKRQREDAATKIQAVQRGKAARLAAEKDLTAPRKQSPVKQDVSDLDAQEREEAAKKIQAVHRGKAARRATADEKQQREDAAKKIQAVQRGKAAQSAAAKPRIKPEKALKAPMKEERGKKTAPAEPRKQAPGKQDVTDLDAQEREEAAKKIQAVQRGKAARTAMAEEKQQREAAATKIQAVQRGKAARMAGTDKKTESKETSGSRRSREKGPGSVGPSEASGARGTKGDEPKGRGKGTPGPDRRSVQSVRSTRSASAGASHSSQRAQARKEKAEAKEAKKAQDAAAAAAAAEPGSVTPSAEPRSPRSPRSPGSTATRRAGSEGSARSGSNSPVHGRGGASRASVISQDRASSSSPRNRQRGSLLSTVSGEADVYLSFKVEGLNQELLSNDVMAQYEDAVKNAILQQAGAGLKNEHLQLRCKKGTVSAKISAPPTVPRAMLHSCLANSSGALSTVLASELANIPDLAHEDIQVTKLELKFGEVSRQSSIILDTRRTFPWPGSKAESAERRVASPRTPRSATPRGRDEAALSRFRTELLRREGSYAAAWRRILDCSGHGYISFAEFCDACRRMNYRGNIKHAWTDLDADGSGKVTLCEIDWATAEALSRFAAALEKSFGSTGQAGKQLGKGGRRLRREEFRSLMMEQGILNQSEVDNIFRMICCNATMARPAVTMKEFEWLSHMIDHLPRPGDRVAPGAETVDLPGTVPGVPCVVAASASPASVVLETSETRTPGSARQRTPSAPLREDAKDLYERLHQEAINYHKRKKAMHEKEGLYRPPGSPAYNTPCKSDAKTLEKIEKLYKTHEVQKKKQEKLTEEYYRQLRGDRPQRREPDEEVWARLQAKKEVKEPKSEAEIEKPRETSNLKYKGPPTRAPPSGNSKEAAERLYAAAKKNESKKKELAGRADQERLEKEEEMKKKMGPITKAREAQLVQRLHQDDHQRREEELKKRMEEKKAAEEEIIQKAQKKGKVRPETFFRLHFEGLQREEGLAERRRLKEKEEVSKLKAASIHRAPHNPGIFHRLYESGRRRTDEAPSSDVEDEQLLSASETEEATRAPSRPAATGRSNSRPRPAKESKTSPEESALRPSSTPKARAQDTRTPEAEEAPPQTKQRSARPSSAPAPRAAKRAASPEKPAKRAASPGKAAKRAASPEKPAKQVASPEKTAKRAASPEKAAKRAASQEKAASAAPAAPASTASPATSSRSKAARVPPGERTGSPSLEKVKEGHRPGQSHEKEMESLQSLRKRSTRSSFGEPSPHKRRSLAAELFGDDDDWGIEQPLPSHSSHADVWGAMTDFVSWDKEAE